MKPYCSIAAGAVVLILPGAATGESTNSATTLPIERLTNQWSFTASVYGYLVPESRD